MNASLLRSLVDYAIFALSVLLLFVLAFESYLVVPAFVGWIGHFHPVVLHLPIALILVAIVQYWRRDQHVDWYISATALLCLITSVTGIFLRTETGAEGPLIVRHQWFGAIVTFLMVLWHYRSSQMADGALKFYHPLLILGILATGHLGGSVTHGEDFLAMKKDSGAKDEVLPDNPLIYAHFVQPILDAKCVSCHNANKTKGQLLLTDFASLKKGGESGSALEGKSGILHHIQLPMDDEDHMPPKSEQQLTASEQTMISYWIASGGSNTLSYNELDREAPIYEDVSQSIRESRMSNWSDLPTIDDTDIEKLNGDYCTVLRKYNNSNALQVLIFPHADYQGAELKALADVTENVVELNVSNLPLSEEDLQLIGTFENLEHLDMHGADFTSAGLGVLAGLEKLSTLKAYGTSVNQETLAKLKTSQSLSQIYLYQTEVTEAQLAGLRQEQPQVKFITIAPKASEFRSFLAVPELEPRSNFFREPFYGRIDYPMEGIDFRYTLDGSDPDENAELLTDSLLIDRDMTLKLIAMKEGWEASPLDSVTFMRSEVLPVAMTMAYPPATAYEGTAEELFDLKKGSRQFADGPWMAFQDDPLILTCELAEETVLQEAVFSTLASTGPYIFPPWRIRVYGGTTRDNMRLLRQMRPAQPKESRDVSLDYYTLPLQGTSVKYLKFHLDPIPRLPSWHPAAGEPGWLFIDEVVLKKPGHQGLTGVASEHAAG